MHETMFVHAWKNEDEDGMMEDGMMMAWWDEGSLGCRWSVGGAWVGQCLCASNVVCSARCMVHGAWCMVSVVCGAWCVHGAWLVDTGLRARRWMVRACCAVERWSGGNSFDCRIPR